MANVFVGLPEHRNSSRVLKPPGGGTSNIFGTEIIPDVIPQHNRSFKEEKNRGSSIQDILRTESSVTKQEQTCTRSSSSSVMVQETSTTTSSTSSDQEVSALPDVAAEVTCKIEELKVEERSSSIEATETDGDGNTKVLANESNSERSVEQNSSTKKGNSIGDILSQEGLEEKKKIKAQVAQRVPPGGYSSGLW